MGQATFAVKRDQLQAVMERVFDAPRETVFKAFVDPAAIPKWWGPRRLTTTVEKLEMKVGGVWRFIQRDPQGNEYAFHGVCTAIDPPKLLSSTFNVEGIPGDHEVLQTVTFEDLGGRTKVPSIATYKTADDLEGMVASGMESGAVESWDRLAELVETRRAPAGR